MEHCDNSPCETAAVWRYTTESGGVMHLCATCADAFELGQVNPDAGLESLDETTEESEDAING